VETRAIDIPAALLVATAALCCSLVVGCAFLLVVVAIGDPDVPGSWAAWSVAAALACANVAALIALTRAAGGLRPSALAVAWAMAFAWPLSGVPVPGALLATLGSGLAVLWGTGRTSGRVAPSAALLVAAALGLLSAAFAGVPSGRPAVGADDRGQHERAVAEPDDRGAVGADETDAAHDTARSNRGAAATLDLPPARVVRAYYRALDRGDFTRAWRALSPAVRAEFGGLVRWRDGYAATLSSRPSGLRVTVSGDEAAVDHVLTARDRAACGVLVQRFSVRWRLRQSGGAWRAAALSAQPLAAPACS
jgi:hypothetical protein